VLYSGKDGWPGWLRGHRDTVRVGLVGCVFKVKIK